MELHADGDGGGRPRLILAANLTRTVLSTVNGAENPTALMAKRELQSWRLLRLEPSALRKPDEITAPIRLGTDGSHLAAMLYHLPQLERSAGNLFNGALSARDASTMLYARLSRRLIEFIDDVREITIDHDEKREILTIMLTGRDGTTHAARALSDGALRFLALAVLELDTQSPGVLCLEEPENGIHPDSIPAMLRLLQDIAVDVEKPVGPDNPLRQVIINTHSPAVVSRVPEESLLVAELAAMEKNGREFKATRFCSLADTWRQNDPEKPATVAKERLSAFFPPVVTPQPEIDYSVRERKKETGTRRDQQTERSDPHPFLPFPTTGETSDQ
jgi:predicted ATPase